MNKQNIGHGSNRNSEDTHNTGASQELFLFFWKIFCIPAIIFQMRRQNIESAPNRRSEDTHNTKISQELFDYFSKFLLTGYAFLLEEFY